MNNSVGSAIEKIKLQEQDNENKLKERREYEAIIFSLNRANKEAIQHAEKNQKELAQLIKKNDILRAELILERTRRDALLAQAQACTKELEDLRAKSEKGIVKVWEVRSSLCTAVQKVADDCDIRALLMKPLCPDLIPITNKKIPADSDEKIKQNTALNEERLKKAIERLEKAINERDRLTTEPDVGEEFVRIKNALQYSLKMIHSLSK